MKRQQKSPRANGFRGVTKVPGFKWMAQIWLHGRRVGIGVFATKQQAAAAYDSAARLNNENAVCNYNSPEDADKAIRAASEYNVTLCCFTRGKWSSSWRGLVQHSIKRRSRGAPASGVSDALRHVGRGCGCG